MQEFKTIVTFTLPSELVVAKSKLESEGIECRVLNELTVQSHNFLSNAIGGVKLQVLESDFDRASTILKEGGFIKGKQASLSFLQRKLSDPVFFKKFRNLAILFFGLIGLIIIVLIVQIGNSRSSGISLLTGQNWCLSHITFQNEVFYPKTIEKIRIKLSGQCDEGIQFYGNGYITIPGFESRSLNGRWEMRDEKIRIFNVDTLEHIFEGLYEIDVSRTEFTLTSDLNEIVGVSQKY